MCKLAFGTIVGLLLCIFAVQPVYASYIDVVVVGVDSLGGDVWGTDTYTSDSRVNRAAMHMGFIELGEAAVVRKTIIGGQESYAGSDRNDVATDDYGAWGESYILSLVNTLSSYTAPIASWADASGDSFTTLDSFAISGDGMIRAVLAEEESVLWVSNNAGSTWSNVSGVGSDINGLTMSALKISRDGSLIALFAGDDLWVTNDNGSTWTNTTAGEDFSGVMSNFVVSEDGDVMVLKTGLNEGTYVSTDRGGVWTNIDVGTTVEGKQLIPFFVSADAQTILTGDTLAATTTWRTTDGGTTWEDVLDDFPHGVVSDYGLRAVSGNGQIILMHGDENLGRSATLLSVNGGTTWENVSTTTAIHGGGIYTDGKVHVSSSGAYLAVAKGGDIFMSSDNGVTWFNVTQGTGMDPYGVEMFALYETASGQLGILAYFNSMLQVATIATPTFSSVSATPSTDGATLSWASDAHASSKITFGPTSSYGTTTSEQNTSTRVTSHSLTLSGLATCTQYHYAATSRTILGGIATSSNNTFTTTGCTSSASVSTSTASTITTAGGGTLDFATTTITIPASFTSTSSSATFQAHELNATTFFAAVAEPTGVDRIGNYVVTLRALADATTTLSSFDEPLTVTMSYEAADVTGFDLTTLKIYRYNGTTWNELSGCTIDTDARTVSCTTTQFSDFALFGTPSEEEEEEEEVGGGSARTYSSSPKTTPATESPEITRLRALIAELTAKLKALGGMTPTVSTTTLPTRDLEMGMEGEEVRALQIYLNTHGFPLAATGPGSQGYETTRFGALTYQALKRFQAAHNVPSTGYYGPLTRKAMAE